MVETTTPDSLFPAPVVADRIRNLVPGDYMHLNSKVMRIEEIQEVMRYPDAEQLERRNIRFEHSGELAFMQFRADDVVLAVKTPQGESTCES